MDTYNALNDSYFTALHNNTNYKEILRRQLGDTCLLEELLDSLEQEELQAIINHINELWGYKNAG